MRLHKIITDSDGRIEGYSQEPHAKQALSVGANFGNFIEAKNLQAKDQDESEEESSEDGAENSLHILEDDFDHKVVVCPDLSHHQGDYSIKRIQDNKREDSKNKCIYVLRPKMRVIFKMPVDLS